jgi:hypothetical protein
MPSRLTVESRKLAAWALLWFFLVAVRQLFSLCPLSCYLGRRAKESYGCRGERISSSA